MKRGKPLERRTRLERNKPLERKTPMRRRAPRRLERRAHLDAHGDFVREQVCCSCGRSALPRPPGHEGTWRTGIEAAHITLSRNQKGMAMKVPDEQRVSLCGGRNGCHKQWDQRRGKFRGWTDDQRYELGAVWVRTTWLRWSNAVIASARAA